MTMARIGMAPAIIAAICQPQMKPATNESRNVVGNWIACETLNPIPALITVASLAMLPGSSSAPCSSVSNHVASCRRMALT